MTAAAKDLNQILTTACVDSQRINGIVRVDLSSAPRREAIDAVNAIEMDDSTWIEPALLDVWGSDASGTTWRLYVTIAPKA